MTFYIIWQIFVKNMKKWLKMNQIYDLLIKFCNNFIFCQKCWDFSHNFHKYLIDSLNHLFNHIFAKHFWSTFFPVFLWITSLAQFPEPRFQTNSKTHKPTWQNLRIKNHSVITKKASFHHFQSHSKSMPKLHDRIDSIKTKKTIDMYWNFQSFVSSHQTRWNMPFVLSSYHQVHVSE